jgi:protein kinase-like protein
VTSEQRRRVRELFEAVVDLESVEAHARIAREAADDAEVEKEVRSLLYHHSTAGEFLEHAVADSEPQLLDDEPLAPGMRVGTYTIEREVGRGGMGRVYLAHDERLGRTIALKALAPHLVGDAAHRERLRREARAAAALTHPGICTVYALEEIDGALYIATEYVDGHTLRDEIRTGARPSPSDAVRTARDLASALASAHERGIVHRDLKPDNVMRTHDGRLKILDFGLARVDRAESPSVAGRSVAPTNTGLLTQPGMMIGTPAYMAPEQINGDIPDARADVFAFGVILYEFLCGTHPFMGSSPLATIARVLESDARPIASRCPDIPARFADVIERCLRKHRDERFASAAAVVDALAAVEGATPGPHTEWWRVHQLVVCGLYVAAAVLGWLIKEWWIKTPLTLGLFLALGAGATIGAVLRGHLVFTEINNRAYLTRERHRTRRPIVLLDLLVAAVLGGDALAVSEVRALWAVFALSLGLGIALGAIVLEPATTAAAFGDE